MTYFARNAAVGLLVASVAGGGSTTSAKAATWSLFSGSTDQGSAQAVPPDGQGQDPAIKVAQAAPSYKDGGFTGQVYDAYYGNVQVKAIITGGQIVSVDVLQYPKDRRTSRYINSQALPILKDEVITAQDIQVDMVSGATLTSEAFVRSLKSALKQAKPGP